MDLWEEEKGNDVLYLLGYLFFFFNSSVMGFSNLEIRVQSIRFRDLEFQMEAGLLLFLINSGLSRASDENRMVLAFVGFESCFRYFFFHIIRCVKFRSYHVAQEIHLQRLIMISSFAKHKKCLLGLESYSVLCLINQTNIALSLL